MTGMQSLLWIRPESAYQKESMNRTDLFHSDKSTWSNLSVEEGQYMRGNPIEVCATPWEATKQIQSKRLNFQWIDVDQLIVHDT